MSSGERVTATKSSDFLKAKFEQRKVLKRYFFQKKHGDSLS